MTDVTQATSLIEKARELKTDYTDSQFIKRAEGMIREGRISEGLDQLASRLSGMRGPNKTRAANLIKHVELASSTEFAMKQLAELPDPMLETPEIIRGLANEFVTEFESLRKTHLTKLESSIPTEKSRRIEARRQAEIARLAELERERLAKLEKERLAKAEEERRVEEARRIAEEQRAKELQRLALEERRKRTFTGRGPEATNVFPLSEGLAIVKLRHAGTANFIVRLLDDDGNSREMLVNSIGPCSISRAVRVPKDGDYLLNIEADGGWEVTIRQPSLA